MTAWITAAVVIFTILPLLVFRGKTLSLYARVDIASYLLAWVLFRQFPGVDPFLACAVVGVAKLAIFSLFLANGEFVRWSANRAALIGLLVYALVAPAMLRVPIDGDEPYYLLITESIIHDRDVDLSNQYRQLERSATGRFDLGPQVGDPTGPHGEQYSRHEPLLSLLLIPGYLVAGLPGTMATIVLFAALLLRSTIRFFEDEAIPDRTARAMFPFIAFGPPIFFYATRIWPEVPAGFLFVEALRGVRQRRPLRWITALYFLSLLKLRFLLVAAPVMLRAIARNRRLILIALLLVMLPLLIVWLISGSATNVHSLSEALPLDPRRYVVGLLGLILDGMSGLLFQAPIYLLGVVAIAKWRSTPEGFRLGLFASALYLFFLIPRSEWHGGWSPPLRYIVFMMPVLALGAAALWDRWSPALVSLIALWTAGVVVHGLAYPWRLFHIANGENAVGEWLSRLYHADFSRLFPSYIRPNFAALVAALALVVCFALFVIAKRLPDVSSLIIAIAALLFAAGFATGRRPGARVEFEDAHVIHRGGELFPQQYTVARFLYRGGWLLRQGDSLSFLARKGSHRLDYAAPVPSTIEMSGRAYHLDATGAAYGTTTVVIDRSGRVELRCLNGAVNLDRMTVESGRPARSDRASRPIAIVDGRDARRLRPGRPLSW